jgi:hypothetical protein
MLYAHEGRPLGTDVGICAAAGKDNSKANGRILIHLFINLGPSQRRRIYTRLSNSDAGDTFHGDWEVF